MKTPWGEMLREAATVGLTPEVFWRLSLKEWRMLMEPRAGFGRLSRDELERLAEAWPDE